MSKRKRIIAFFILLLIGSFWIWSVTAMQETSHAYYEARSKRQELVFEIIKDKAYTEAPAITEVASFEPQEYPHDSTYYPRPWDELQVQAASMLKGYPLIDYTMEIAEACYYSGMDVEWFCRIAIHESTGGANTFQPYNAWGWMAPLGDNSSWEETIPIFCEQFVEGYGSGLNETNHLKYDPNGSYSIYFDSTPYVLEKPDE